MRETKYRIAYQPLNDTWIAYGPARDRVRTFARLCDARRWVNSKQAVEG